MGLLKKLSEGLLIGKAEAIRKDLIEVCVKNGAGHIAPSLSCVDILTALYYRVMDIYDDTGEDKRDRLVFSKGHGVYGLYKILSDIGYIDEADWKNFYDGSPLEGCIERRTEYGIEASCGSLGHGLPVAAGIAFGAKLQGKDYMTYCIAGDGEMQEGSNWEAIQFAVKHKLSGLVLIIDNNGLQAMDFLENILTPKDRKDHLKEKLEAFGFLTENCDGHNIGNMVNILETWKNKPDGSDMPKALIADTIKGCGLKCMENIPKFHFRIPTEDELLEG